MMMLSRKDAEMTVKKLVGVTRGEEKRFQVLEEMALNGPITAYAGAKRLNLPIPTVQRIFKELKNCGLITRFKNPFKKTIKKTYGLTSVGFALSLGSKKVYKNFDRVVAAWAKEKILQRLPQGAPKDEYIKLYQEATITDLTKEQWIHIARGLSLVYNRPEEIPSEVLMLIAAIIADMKGEEGILWRILLELMKLPSYKKTRQNYGDMLRTWTKEAGGKLK